MTATTRWLLPLACLAAGPILADPPVHAVWEPTFADEFNGDAVDWDVWASQAGRRGPDNLESRWPENNVVRDGLLHQITRHEAAPRDGKEWTTAHIWTRSFRQQYGYFECRMRYGRYLNNAFWLYRPPGKDNPPPNFEIDVNEGHTPRELAMTLHFFFQFEGEPRGERHATSKRWDAPVDLDQELHVYAVEWDQKLIVWYFDGQPVRVVENPGADAPADVRLSTVIMPRQLERDQVDVDTLDGGEMAVDWVRVYRKVRDLSAPELALPVERLPKPTIVTRERQVAPAARRTVVLQEDFEAPGGAPPHGWEIGSGEPTVEEHRLRLDGGEYVYRMLPQPITDRLEIELDALQPNADPGLLLVTLGSFDATDPKQRADSYYTGDIGPYLHWCWNCVNYYTEADKWVRFARWPPGAWGHARFVLDVKRGTFDYYTGPEDHDYVSGGAFRGRPKAVRGIGLRHRGTGAPVFVDNVVVRVLDD